VGRFCLRERENHLSRLCTWYLEKRPLPFGDSGTLDENMEFREWLFVIERSFKSSLVHGAGLKSGDILVQPNISSICTTQNAQSLFNCVLHTYFKGCHRNNKRPVVETTSFPSLEKKKIRSLWAWSTVRSEPAQIILC
jgi:hypothetical protein